MLHALETWGKMTPGQYFNHWVDMQFMAVHPILGDVPGNGPIRAFLTMLKSTRHE